MDQKLEAAWKKLSKQDKSKLLTQYKKERAFNDLFYFCTKILGYDKMTKKTHGELCTLLDNFEKNNRNLLILMPRCTFKTTIVIFGYVVRELLRNPEKASYALQLASFEKGTDWMMEIQNNLEKPEVVKLFGSYKNPTCWRKDKIILRGAPKSREGSVMIFGADQGLAGYHPKRIIFDDLHDDKNSQTPEQVKKIVKTFSRTITDVASKDTKCIMVATIWDRKDSARKIIEQIEGLS